MTKFIGLAFAMVTLLACVLMVTSISKPFKVDSEVKEIADRTIVLYDSAKYVEAAALAEEALKLADSKCKKNSASHGLVYYNLGLVYYASKEYKKALPWAQKSMAIQERLFKGEPDQTFKGAILLAHISSDTGDLNGARNSYMKALNIIQEHVEPSNIELAYIRGELAGVYLKLKEYNWAETYFKKSIKSLEANLGPGHKDLGPPKVGFALTLQALKKWDEAEKVYLDLLEQLKKGGQDSRDSVASVYSGLGAMYHHQELYEKSLEAYKKSHEIVQAIYEPADALTGTSYSRLASAHYGLRDYKKADQFYRKALDILTKDETVPSFEVIHVLISLGVCDYVTGLYDKADGYLKRAIALLKKDASGDKEQLALCLNIYGANCIAQGYFLKGQLVLEEALKLTEKDSGSNDPDSKKTMRCETLISLSESLFNQKMFEESEKCILRAQKLWNDSEPLDLIDIALGQRTLARMYRKKKEYKTSVKKAEEAILTLRKAKKTKGLEMGSTLLCLAISSLKNKDYEKAWTKAVKASVIYEKNLKKDNTYLATVNLTLAETAIPLKKYKEAWKLVKEAQSSYVKHLGKESPQVGLTLVIGGDIYMAQKNYKKAEPLYKKGISILKKGYSPNHPDLVESVEKIAKLYIATGKNNSASSLIKDFKKARAQSLKMEQDSGRP